MRDQAGSNRSSRLKVSLGALVLLLSYQAGCVAMGPPLPATGYRADVTATITDASSKDSEISRVEEFYYKGKRRRQTQIDGLEVALIDRPDLLVSWKLNPKAKSFEEHRIASQTAAIHLMPNPFGPRSKAVFESLGIEKFGGAETQKYAVEGKEISGFAWFTADQIPVRFRGTFDTGETWAELEITYSEVQRGSQAAYLFAIPPTYAGYNKRKQPKDPPPSTSSIDDAGRRLEEQQRGRQYQYPTGPNGF